MDNIHDWYIKPEYEYGQLVYKPPHLNELWHDKPACFNRKYIFFHKEATSRREVESKRVNMTYIVPTYTTSNSPPTGITITYDEMGDSNDYYLYRPASESEGDTGLYVPSDFLPEGAYLPLGRETAPHRCSQVPTKNILTVKFGREMKTIS